LSEYQETEKPLRVFYNFDDDEDDDYYYDDDYNQKEDNQKEDEKPQSFNEGIQAEENQPTKKKFSSLFSAFSKKEKVKAKNKQLESTSQVTPSENNLTISAWWPHAFLGEMCIEQTGLGNINMMIKSYRNSLNTLFQEIEKLNQNNTASFDNNINQSTQLFQNETSKKEEMLCEIAFWASILGVFITVFFGRMFGLIVQVLIIYYAIKGLHTKKRIKAIIALILSVISLAIFALSFLLAIIQ
jgi:hypothetical protein